MRFSHRPPAVARGPARLPMPTQPASPCAPDQLQPASPRPTLVVCSGEGRHSLPEHKCGLATGLSVAGAHHLGQLGKINAGGPASPVPRGSQPPSVLIRLRASLAANPVPNGPIVTASEPMASKRGTRPAITSGSPPHIQIRLPDAAADGPPLTPQSMIGTPSAVARRRGGHARRGDGITTTTVTPVQFRPRRTSGPTARRGPARRSQQPPPQCRILEPVSWRTCDSCVIRVASVASALTSHTTRGTPVRRGRCWRCRRR